VLNPTDIAILSALLDNNDRAGFYVEYYNMTKVLNRDGARQY
jgi:hypothetical protein